MQIYPLIDPLALKIDGTNSPTANINWGGFSITNFGNITGSDIDIDAGTGDYLSTGTIASGAITATKVGGAQLILESTSSSVITTFFTTGEGILQIDSSGNLVTLTGGTRLAVDGSVAIGNGVFIDTKATGVPTARGGSIAWGSGSDFGVYTGFTFVNLSNRFVWDNTVQGGHLDTGVAWVDFDDGSCSFAGGDFDIDSSGNITDVGNITSDGLGTFGELTVDFININDRTINVTSGDLIITAAGGDISFGTNNITTTGLATFDNLTVVALTTFGEISVNTTGTNNEEVLHIDNPDISGAGHLKEFGLALGDGVQYGAGRAQIYGISAGNGTRVRFMQFRTQGNGATNNIQFLADFVELANNKALAVTSADVGAVIPVNKITSSDVVEIGANYRENIDTKERQYPVVLYYGQLNDATDLYFDIIQKTAGGNVTALRIDHNRNFNFQAGDITTTAKVTANELSTTEFIVEPDGDTYWVGAGSGLVFGSMYNNNTPTTVAIGTSGVFERIPSGFAVGQLNNTTFANAREITVLKAGKYEITWSLSFNSDGGSNLDMEGAIGINNTKNDQGTAHRKIGAGNDIGNIASGAILDLAANAVVSLMMTNNTNTVNIIVDHASLSLVQVGG